jgi:hypothetical protein
MVLGERKLLQGLKPSFIYAGFSARLRSCPDTEQKQIIRASYPTYAGPQACPGQDDNGSKDTKRARMNPRPVKAVVFWEWAERCF